VIAILIAEKKDAVIGMDMDPEWIGGQRAENGFGRGVSDRRAQVLGERK
jgi:hypothetical protein